jgi:lipopolysaccharide export LptBFGC system permease protein LptF
LVPIVALFAIYWSKVDARRGRFYKIIPSILFYLVYVYLLTFFKSKISQNPEYVWGPWMLHALSLTVILFLIFSEKPFWLKFKKRL